MALLEVAKELQIQPKVVLLAVAKITKIVNNNRFRYNNTFNSAGIAIRRAKCIYLIQFQGCIFCLIIRSWGGGWLFGEKNVKTNVQGTVKKGERYR